MLLQTRRHAGMAPATPVRTGLVCLYLALALASFLLISPVLAGLSFVVAMGVYSLSLDGEGRRMFPAWSFPALAVFFIPPPLQLDSELYQLLAGLAASLSQGWLDTMGIIHVVDGVIVATPAKRFFVDDACSGTNSLLVALCVAVILATMKKRSVAHLGMLLLATGLVSVATNVLRICVVIGALHFWKVELDNGLPHDLLGFAFFGLDLLLILSADHGVQFSLNRPLAQSEAPAWNGVSMTPRGRAASSLWHRRISLLGASAGLVMLLGPMVLSMASASPGADAHGAARLEHFLMPAKLGMWVREGEKPVEDTVIGKLGVRNQVWIYRNNGLEAYVAVNFPFRGIHDTRLCYQGQGWKFQKQEDGNLPGDPTANSVRFLQMDQPTELMRAALWLCVLDEHGVSFPFTNDNLTDRMTGRLTSRWTKGREQSTTYVLQVLAVEPATQDAAKRSYLDLVAGARSGLAEAISNPAATQGKESE